MDFPEAFLLYHCVFLSNNARIFLEKYGNECIKFIKCYKNIN